MTHHREGSTEWATMSIQEILELAIRDEVEAQEYYRHAATLAGNAHTREMLLKLSAMEQDHAVQLRKELEELRLQSELETGIAD